MKIRISYDAPIVLPAVISLMQKLSERERLVKSVSAFLADTPLAPDAYERQLLTQFVAGELTIHRVLEILAEREAQAAVPTPSGEASKVAPFSPRY